MAALLVLCLPLACLQLAQGGLLANNPKDVAELEASGWVDDGQRFVVLFYANDHAVELLAKPTLL